MNTYIIEDFNCHNINENSNKKISCVNFESNNSETLFSQKTNNSNIYSKNNLIISDKIQKENNFSLQKLSPKKIKTIEYFDEEMDIDIKIDDSNEENKQCLIQNKKAAYLPDSNKRSKTKLDEENSINSSSKFIPILQKYENCIPLDYIPEIWQNLKISEKSPACEPKYNSIFNQVDVNFDMRAILIDWIIDVHKNYHLYPETLFICISIIDRYLSKKSIHRTKLQLLGTTALFISSKYEEITYPCINEFTKITDDAFSKEEVLQMENEIFTELNFEITFPSSFRFFEIISLNYNFSEVEFYYGCYLIEYFTISPTVTKYYPSIIALSVVLVILKLKKYENYKDLYNLTDSPDDHKLIKECAWEIYEFPYKCKSFNLNSVYNKYSSSKYHCVALNELDTQNHSE